MKKKKQVDSRILHGSKRYSDLKQRQKARIAEWMYAAYKRYYLEKGHYPHGDEDASVMEEVMGKIHKDRIVISYNEVLKRLRGYKIRFRKRVEREMNPPKEVRKRKGNTMTLEPLAPVFSVCKVEDYHGIEIDQPFCFTGRTDEEKSLVCPVELVPDNTAERDDGWRAFRICGTLDFSLIGILSKIATVLAGSGIGIFAISTFNTDYVLTKEENFDKAIYVLKAAGYPIKGEAVPEEEVASGKMEKSGESLG